MKHELLKKSIAFRVYSVLIMAAFFYFMTGSLEQMTLMTVLVEAIKTVQYSIFEYFWCRHSRNCDKKKKA